MKTSKMIESAMADSKSPRRTSSRTAVVSTLVSPARLPPTINEAPTSEIAVPKPAMSAANSGSRASCITSQSICQREAPSE